MLQAWYDRTGPARDVLRVGEAEKPLPAAGQVLVRIAASGINPSDCKQRAGFPGGRSQAGRIVPHSDGAGTVEAVGDAVEQYWLGRRVWIWNARGGSFYGTGGGDTGTAGAYLALPVEQVVPLPDNTGFDLGAALGAPACTAHYLVFADGDVAGQTILIRGGAGAVGELAVQFAHAAGARVIATVSSSEKAAIAGAAGAGHVVNYRTENVTNFVRGLCPDGVDRIIEVDFARNVAEDAALIRQNGTIASYSSPSNPTPVLPYYALQFKGATVRFVQGFSLPAAARRIALRQICIGVTDGWLRPTIAARYPLSEIAAAHELVESGRAVGNVVLVT